MRLHCSVKYLISLLHMKVLAVTLSLHKQSPITIYLPMSQETCSSERFLLLSLCVRLCVCVRERWVERLLLSFSLTLVRIYLFHVPFTFTVCNCETKRYVVVMLGYRLHNLKYI